MPVDVKTEAVINRPPAEVAAFAGNPDNATKWYVNIKEARWVTPPPLQVGSRVAFAAEFMGKRLEYTYAFTELVEGKRLVMRTAEGPFPMETTYTWDPEGGGATRMGLRNRGSPTGFSRLFTPFMKMAMRRANRKDLAKLKALLEGGATSFP